MSEETRKRAIEAWTDGNDQTFDGITDALAAHVLDEARREWRADVKSELDELRAELHGAAKRWNRYMRECGFDGLPPESYEQTSDGGASAPGTPGDSPEHDGQSHPRTEHAPPPAERDGEEPCPARQQEGGAGEVDRVAADRVEIIDGEDWMRCRKCGATYPPGKECLNHTGEVSSSVGQGEEDEDRTVRSIIDPARESDGGDGTMIVFGFETLYQRVRDGLRQAREEEQAKVPTCQDCKQLIRDAIAARPARKRLDDGQPGSGPCRGVLSIQQTLPRRPPLWYRPPQHEDASTDALRREEPAFASSAAPDPVRMRGSSRRSGDGSWTRPSPCRIVTRLGPRRERRDRLRRPSAIPFPRRTGCVPYRRRVTG